MRLFSTILVTYILLLTAAPSLSMVYRSHAEHCKKSCCHSEQNQKQSDPTSQQNKGCCNNGVCNPFMSCCNCYALTAKLQVLRSLAYTNQKYTALTENPNSVFLSEAWHPPKTV